MLVIFTSIFNCKNTKNQFRAGKKPITTAWLKFIPRFNVTINKLKSYPATVGHFNPSDGVNLANYPINSEF